MVSSPDEATLLDLQQRLVWRSNTVPCSIGYRRKNSTLTKAFCKKCVPKVLAVDLIVALILIGPSLNFPHLNKNLLSFVWPI